MGQTCWRVVTLLGPVPSEILVSEELLYALLNVEVVEDLLSIGGLLLEEGP